MNNNTVLRHCLIGASIFATVFMQQQLTEIFRFIKSHEFKRALLMTSLMLTVGFSLYFLKLQDYIVGVCIGILLTSFSDMQGSFRHRNLAMLLSIVTNLGIILLMNIAASNVSLLLLTIGLLSFMLANLSVYGNRASMFTLSGLLAMVFGLIHTYSFQQLLLYLLSILAGCLLYFFVSLLYHWLTKKSQTIERLGELAGLTSDYLLTRLKLAKQNDEILADEEVLELQSTIITKQEEVRNLILADRQFGGKSSSRNTYMLLLIELIDIMELAVANPAKFQIVKENLEQEDKFLPPFYQLAETIGIRLQHFAHIILDRKKMATTPNFESLLYDAETSIKQYVKNIGLPQARQGAIMLRNLHDYLEKQVFNLESIERLLSNVERQRQIDFSRKKHGRFLTNEHYKLETLIENLHIKAPIFRHSIRLTLALLIGYSIGKIMHVENAYWILLTIVVIMRPAYGLTKERSNKRVLGTILGVILAIGLVQISNNPFYYVGISAFSMLFAFSLLQRNYLLAATAITLNVVFVFSLIDANHWQVISYRLIDTIIGAGVSLLVSYLVFPNWEYVNIKSAFTDVILSNKNYLQSIANYYKNPTDDIDLRLKRKEAFLSTSELNSAFQRFTKDPSSKQKNYSTYYEIITLNQSILSSLANLGSYIKTHHIADVNSEFQEIAGNISLQLETIIKQLNSKKAPIETNLNTLDAEIELIEQWERLENRREEELAQGKIEIDTHLRLQLQEVKLMIEELNWLQAATNALAHALAKL